jgi:leucine-rich repeat protein SHOC2
MNNDTAFLQAILASPEDRALRLVYADWLEEQGDARGELLRVVEAMRHQPVCTARYRKLRLRRDALSKGCDGDWLKSMLRVSFPDIRARLEELARRDKRHTVFASYSHLYGLCAPLTDRRVKQIEKRIGCRLPEQYRQFITEFAACGAGPDYGVRSLEDILKARDNRDLLASLARPFPVPTSADEARALGYAPPGALPICEIGCGSYHYLILSGPEQGNVWIENADVGWTPALLDESHVPSGPDVKMYATLEAAIRSPQQLKLGFLDWYVNWLDAALWKVSCTYTPVDKLFDLGPETTSVNVTGRKLKALPESVRRLTTLTSLKLHENSLTKLPDWIGELTKLEFLGVVKNPLRELPASIGNLVGLRRLNCIITEALRQLPDSIGRLVELEELQLGFNKLRAVPDSIGNLRNLRKLDLQRNQLTDLPAAMGGLRHLRELDLSRNKLAHLPPTIANLVHLETLDLMANRFRKLPDGVGQLPALHALHLCRNPGLDFSDAFRKLAGVPTLRRLHLTWNKLNELPDEIGLLTQITSLDLSRNDLVSLPAALAHLTNLETLTVDDNPGVTALRNQLRLLLPHCEGSFRISAKARD